MSDDERGGCIVKFNKPPMLQDYNDIINTLWYRQLQRNYPNYETIKITTELVES